MDNTSPTGGALPYGFFMRGAANSSDNADGQQPKRCEAGEKTRILPRHAASATDKPRSVVVTITIDGANCTAVATG